MKNFEDLYVKARKQENRILSDEQVEKLPLVNSDSMHAKEWLLRKKSFDQLRKYINTETDTTRLLDLGCGNGWMTSQLSTIFMDSLGIDVNRIEIEQAQRVFKKSNLEFKVYDIFQDSTIGTFDIITISAVLQYFEKPKELFSHLQKEYLNPRGKILISDTFFYNRTEKTSAKKRSQDYYQSIGVPEMSKFYFHHSEEIFSDFNVEIVSPLKWWDHSFLRKWTKPSPFKIYSLAH